MIILSVSISIFTHTRLSGRNGSAYPLLWPLVFAITPLETGLMFPEAADEPEQEAEVMVEEARWALFTAAFLKYNKKINKSTTLTVIFHMKLQHYLNV